jgi:hypothetical protein
MNEATTYTTFTRDTGAPLGHVTCDPDQLGANLRALTRAHGREIVAKLGEHHLYASRLDPETDEVKPWRPERPDEFHEWSEAEGVWKLTAERLQQRERDRAARARISELDLQQIRSMSALFDNPNDADARVNYDRRKAEIAELRQSIVKARDPAPTEDSAAEEQARSSAQPAG